MKGSRSGSLRTVCSIRVCSAGPARVARVVQGMQSSACQKFRPHPADFPLRTHRPILEKRGLISGGRCVLSGHSNLSFQRRPFEPQIQYKITQINT